MRRVLASSAFATVVLSSFFARAQAPACTAPVTFCEGNNGYYVPPDDKDKVQRELDPLLKELRSCLDAAGGRHVQPVIVIRFDADAKPVESKVEAGGYESLPCVAQVTAKLVNARSVRETAMRCEYGCPKPKTSPPVTPPPVTPAPAPAPTPTTTPTQTTPAPAPAPAPYSTGTHTEKTWYGWQNLVADAASITMGAAGFGAKSGGLEAAGYIGYTFGSPTVHWVHGNIGPGFGSMALRLFLPWLGLGVGVISGLIAGASKSSNSLDDTGSAIYTGGVVGFWVGVAIPVAIDAAALGWEKEDVPNTPVRPTGKLTVKPILSIQPERSGGFAGLGGTF
jgi:hypothetical protein